VHRGAALDHQPAHSPSGQVRQNSVQVERVAGRDDLGARAAQPLSRPGTAAAPAGPRPAPAEIRSPTDQPGALADGEEPLAAGSILAGGR